MRRTFGVVACAFLWCACPRKDVAVEGAPDAGPTQVNEVEPNDRSEQALSISQSTVVSAQLTADAARIDEDWFELHSPGPASLDVRVGDLAKGDLVLEVLDSDRNRLVMVNSTGEGQAERIPNLGLTGRAFLRVSGARRGIGGSYTLTVLYRPQETGTEVEPNDRAVEANSLVLGAPISGLLGHAADEDWYRFELPQNETALADGSVDASVEGSVDASVEGSVDAGLPGAQGTLADVPDAGPSLEEAQLALRIELSEVAGVRYELSVLSEAEAPLFNVKGKESEGLSLRNVGVRAHDQRVYVVVKSIPVGTGPTARRGFDAERPYTLSVAMEEAGVHAEYEPNDERTKATPLPLEGYKEGFLSPKTDVDYYVLKSDTPVVARLQLSGVDRLDLMLSVVSPPDEEESPETVLLKVNDGVLKEPEYLNNLACSGTCYLKVEGALKKVDGKWVRDFENADLPYRLTVSTRPDDGSEEREPNQTVNTAMAIELGRPVRGTIYPKKDVDYFRLDLSNRVVRTPLRARVTGILKVDLGLYLHRLEAGGKLSLVQTADRARGDATETIQYSVDPAVYLLEVRDTRHREANFQDSYQLTVEEHQPASP